ncbi:hypothetical protein PN36_03530 [Candidatus Thiomargarita nelsonii]|uniref:Uncharacterized protein n=1 Tax=Candidatus Thiomargarita nelsonii TaxID=1003181 RepID=A0A0A6PEF8_9GAMM|nr:hypothetical protein PN36_03530 [Candidatus Thiomargarita nelsonii]
MKNKNVVGHCTGGGAVIRGLVTAAAALLFSVNVSASLVIDNFKDGTRVEANDQSLCAEGNQSHDPTSKIMGTQRDMSIVNADGRVTMDSFFAGLLIIEQENQAGEIILQWDGVDADGSDSSRCVLNHTGLGGLNLMEGIDLPDSAPSPKIHLMVSSTNPSDTQIRVRIYTDATHWSTALLDINSDQIKGYWIERPDFTMGAGADGPVDFKNVGAIEMQIIVLTPGRVSLGFDLIETSVTLGESTVQVVPPIAGLPGGLSFKWNTLAEFNNAGFIVGQRVPGGDWEALSGFMEADNPGGATYQAFISSGQDDPCTDCEYGLADFDTDGTMTIHVIE